MTNTLNKINNIPVRTWRWLGVNNISLSKALPEIKPYTLKVIPKAAVSGIKIEENSRALALEFALDTYKGISENSLSQCRNDFNTGVFIKTEENKKAAEPIFINYVMNKENSTVIDNNLIVAEENSEVTVVINYSSEDNESYFHNGLTQVYAKKGSTVNLIKIQSISDESIHLDANASKLEADATVNYLEVSLGALYSVTNYTADLEGSMSSGNIDSIYLGDKERNVDINYLINHIGKATLSNIETRGALLDKSKKIFRGTLDFRKGSSKSKGQEEEYTVLLSPQVRNQSVPILLCTEDDVEGQHAASAGRIDENKLFYIMSRGLSEKEAKKLIIEAAFNPIINKIPSEELKNKISDSIRRKLVDE